VRKNKLKQQLRSGEPTLATHLHSIWPSVVEVVGHTGVFDYVEFVAEYAPFDLNSLDNFCRAVELHDMSAMIKVDQEPRGFLAQRGVGSGFQGVLFSDCRTVEDVRECIRAVKPETPEAGGHHGVATRRITYMGYGGSPEYARALDETVVALMIEKKAAVEHLDEILALGGIDMIQWGPADYSLSIGRPGEWRQPDIKAVERRVIETGLKTGIPPRAEIESVDQAKYYLDLGVRHFALGTDVKVLFDWLKGNGENLRKALEGS
jgi:4-hydroxy-2-oxoheptanedioate aldolase